MSTLRTKDFSQWNDHILHFDLTGAHPDEEYWLNVNGKKHPLKEHTSDSLAEARANAPHLSDVPDKKLTHYTPKKVKLPHDQTLRIQVQHSLKSFDHLEGANATSHVFIHLPPRDNAQEEHPMLQAAGGFEADDKTKNADDKTQSLPKDVNPPEIPPPPPPHRIFHVNYDWAAAAKALLFHHPDLMCRDPKYAQYIFDHMGSSDIAPMISNSATAADGLPIGLSERMAYYGLWTSSPNGGWYTLKPVKIPTITGDGKKIPFQYDEKNKKTIYQNMPIDAIMDYAGDTLTAILVATKNDLRLKGKKWRASTGLSAVNTQGTLIQPKEKLEHKLVASEHHLVASGGLGDDWTPKLTTTDEHYGLSMTNITSELAQKAGKDVHAEYYAKKRMAIKLENHYLRYLGIYVVFLDADGNRIDLDNVSIQGLKGSKWMPNDEDWSFQDSNIATSSSKVHLESNTIRYVDTIHPRNAAMGIPVPPNGEKTIYITFPEDAVKAEIYGCGLGTGANDDPSTTIVGGVLTGFVNIALPALMMGFAVASQNSQVLYGIMQRPKVIFAAVTAGAIYYEVDFLHKGVDEKRFDWHAFTSLCSIVFTKGLNKVLVWLTAEETLGEAEDQIPAAGWAMTAANIAADAAQIEQTIVEIAMSPWKIGTGVSTSIKSSLTVYPDPRLQAWPASGPNDKLSVVAKMIYKNQTHATKTLTVDLPDGYDKVNIGFTFDENVLGGQVKFEVDYYINDWIAGKAHTTFLENNETTTEKITLYLVDIPRPLNANSVFQHSNLLTYQGSNYTWKPTADAPTSAYMPDDSNEGNAISKWVGLALSQRYASLGMTWKAARTGLEDSKTGQSNTQLYALQNVNIPGRPMDHAKFTDSGFTNQATLIYDPYPPKFETETDGQWVIKDNEPVIDPKDKNLGDFFIDPRKAAENIYIDGGYHLRKVDLSTNENFNPNGNQTLSHGRFPFFPDHQCIHPNGHMVAVNQKHGKIMILKINEEGAADDAVPLARYFSGTAQNTEREGLLFQPIAVACSSEGTILILDFTREATIKTPAAKGKIDISTTTVARIQAFNLEGNPVPRFHDVNGNPSSILKLPTTIEGYPVDYLDMVAVGTNKMTYMFVLYYVDNPAILSDSKEAAQYYRMSIYQYGTKAPDKNPLVTTNGVAAARIQVDMWHSMYTLNYAKMTDGNGKEAGPPVGSGIRTIPSLSEWLPPLPKKS